MKGNGSPKRVVNASRAGNMARALLAGVSGLLGGNIESRGVARRLNRVQYGRFTHTKHPGPSRAAQKRLKAKAKGVAKARARHAYRSPR